MPTGIYERKIRTKYPFEWKHSKHEGLIVSGNHKKKLPPLEILNWLFRYEESSGKLFKVRESSGKAIEPAREITAVGGNGYKVVNIKDSSGVVKLFLVHQLCYFIHSGEEPLSIIDHINRIKTDNKFENLRLVTQSLNQRNKGMLRNNTSGVTGLTWDKSREKWQAKAYDNTGKNKFLGYFEDKEIAVKVISEYYSNPSNGYTSRHGL